MFYGDAARVLQGFLQALVSQVDEEVSSEGLPTGLYPTPFLGYRLFYTTAPNHKTRYSKKGVGYEPLGRVSLELGCEGLP